MPELRAAVIPTPRQRARDLLFLATNHSSLATAFFANPPTSIQPSTRRLLHFLNLPPFLITRHSTLVTASLPLPFTSPASEFQAREVSPANSVGAIPPPPPSATHSND